jgi:hypothetical protein
MIVLTSADLQRAARHIFSLGVPDLATELCEANTAIGLAKTHFVQQVLGVPADAIFIGGPDMTVTRNLGRWRSGFAYGGKLDWGGPEPMVVLQVKPNVCGTLVAGAESVPPEEALAERLARVRRRPGAVDGIPLEFDLDRSNHFLSLYTPPPDSGLPPHVLVLHGAAPELRGDNLYGWGLYWDRSPALLQAARHFDTPWGPLDVLVGEAVEKYWHTHQHAAAFAAERRLLLARALLGEVQPISNEVHQGLLTPSEMYLGCHATTQTDVLLPFMVDRGAPAYLLRGQPNLTREQLEGLGWIDRAWELGVLERLERTNLLPHGSGYAVGGPGEVAATEAGAKSTVRLRRGGERRTANPRRMVTGYRGEEVLRQLLRLGLGEVSFRLEFERLVVAPD